MIRWSYSSMSLFQQCPKKYFHLRVAKDIKQEESEQMRYGLVVHKAAEDYVRDGTPLPEAFSYMAEPLDRLKKFDGDKYCEHQMGITQDLQACSFAAPDVWWRGIADLLIVNGDTARVVDYKTGKVPADQYKASALLPSKIYAYLCEQVLGERPKQIRLLYVQFGKTLVVDVTDDDVAYAEKRVREAWAKIDGWYEEGYFPPQRNNLCDKWCSFRNICPLYSQVADYPF